MRKWGVGNMSKVSSSWVTVTQMQSWKGVWIRTGKGVSGAGAKDRARRRKGPDEGRGVGNMPKINRRAHRTLRQVCTLGEHRRKVFVHGYKTLPSRRGE
jgi:hypothetical protein